MVETLAELRQQFQKQRDYEMRLYAKVTGCYSDYYLDDPDQYYSKNIKETKK
jgi:hypothetical protein